MRSLPATSRGLRRSRLRLVLRRGGLAGAVAGGLGVAVVIANLTQSSEAIPITASVFAALFAILASILALVRLIWPPHGLDRAAGVWIGTAAALALAVSALRLLRDERRGAPGLAQVEITTLPAPRGDGA
jgi:hypothetical protein